MNGDVAQTFIAVEGESIGVTRGVASAVDRLLKLHFIMHMEYAAYYVSIAG